MAVDRSKRQVDSAAQRRSRIRTFSPRRGRLGSRHLDALTRLWPQYGVDLPQSTGEPIRLSELFARPAPVVLEVHTPGIANLLAIVDERALRNVRLAWGDALDVVRRLPEESLDAAHAFFPDPWPKARHQKRRVIQPANVALLRSRLVPAGP